MPTKSLGKESFSKMEVVISAEFMTSLVVANSFSSVTVVPSRSPDRYSSSTLVDMTVSILLTPSILNACSSSIVVDVTFRPVLRSTVTSTVVFVSRLTL